MQHIAIRERPIIRPVCGLSLLMLGLALSIVALGMDAALLPDRMHRISCFGIASVGMMFWTVFTFFLCTNRGYNHKLPGLIEKHLDSHLTDGDYAQLYQAALQYPAIHPWLADRMKKGVLSYRDAEPLVTQINQYIDAHPIAAGAKTAGSQQALLQLLESGTQLTTPTGTIPTDTVPVSVRFRSDTTGATHISIQVQDFRSFKLTGHSLQVNWSASS